MKSDLLTKLMADKKAKRSFALATDLESGAQALVYPDAADGEDFGDAILGGARDAIRGDRSTIVESDGRRVFVEVFNPPLRMIIVGAVHIAQPLSRMAAVGGYDVTIVDPRGSFATDERFPGVALVNEWPDEAVSSLKPDRRTAVVTLTHDPKIDDPGLQSALKSDAFYLGSLGSRKTHAARLERLAEAGFTDQEMQRIHGPVGLSIGAKSPAEIAVSILAQITDVLHRKDAA